MNVTELTSLLDELLAHTTELGWLEWKSNNQDPQQIGEYISAISNSAALSDRSCGYMVWGIQDGTRHPVGTSFQPRAAKGQGNQALIMWLQTGLQPRINFEFYGFQYKDVNVVLLVIDKAHGLPTSFRNEQFIRLDSHKTRLSTVPAKHQMLLNKLSNSGDWTAEIVSGADMTYLDESAIAFGRKRYKEKHSDKASDVDTWDDAKFLHKLKIAREGKLTRAALLLFGKEDAGVFPSVPMILATNSLRGVE